MEDIIDIIVTETTNLIEITSQPTDEVIDVNIIDNREDIVLNVTPSVVEININSLTGNFGVNWGDIDGTLSNQTDLQNALNLKADLVDGKVPSSQLPSYVDDIVEVATYSALPTTGETGKIYVVLDTNLIYRWSGSAYIEIKDSSAVWGAITGTLSSQTDLQNALNAKFNNPTGDSTQYLNGAGTPVTFPIAGQSGTLVREVRNTTGATLTKGTIVYISGATGNKPTVSKAIATGDSTSAQTFGMCQANISNNSNGYVVCVGDITGLDTSALSEGVQLYLSSTTAGTYTTTKQVAPAHLVYIGVVTRSHPTQGQIEVKIQNGYELDEIHDVLITSKDNNDGLFYESSTSLWKNKSIATVLGYTPVDAFLTANYVPKSTSSTTLANSNIQDSGSLITLGSNTTISSGALGIGTSSLTGYNLRISKNITGATTSIGIHSDGTIQSDVTGAAYLMSTNAATQAASFTLNSISHYRAFQATFGAGSTVTNQYGFLADASLSGATNNYGFYGNIVASGNSRWNLYMNGSANNYLASSLGIGATSLTEYALRVSKNITGATTSFGISVDGTIQSDVTTTTFVFHSRPNTAASAFTLTNLVHFEALQGTIGSGSTITNQVAFDAGSNLTGATNNFGFRGQIAAGTNRWNLYMAGTANNYLAGNLLIGSTADNSFKLQVTGSASISAGLQVPTINQTYSGASKTSLYVDASRYAMQTISGYAIAFEPGGTETMRITSAGNVGIGTTSPSEKLHLNNSSGTGTFIRFQDTSGGGVYIGGRDERMELYAGGSERMRITSGGFVLIGTTVGDPVSSNVAGISFEGSYGSGKFSRINNACLDVNRVGGTDGEVIRMYKVGSQVGNISVTSSSTSYNTSSDYRLKEDLKPIKGLEIVNKIKVYDYKWKLEDSRMDGVLAHELAEVLPYAVTGVKDGEQMQSVDYSKIVPVMVQAIKELKAELDTLKNK